MRDLPRADNQAKPDFLAPGPRAIISSTEVLLKKTPLDADPDEDEDDFGAPTVWYASPKVLGRLYRAIDEEKFLETIKANMAIANRGNRTGVLLKVWDYMEEQTRGHASWRDYVEEAIQQREEFVSF